MQKRIVSIIWCVFKLLQSKTKHILHKKTIQPKTVSFGKYKYFTKTLPYSDPFFCSKSLFECRNACFSSNSVYVSLSKAKQNILTGNLIHAKTVEFSKYNHFYNTLASSDPVFCSKHLF